MKTSRFLACTLLLLAGMIAGCASSSERSSGTRAARGGFSVLVDGSDQPASARVLADIGAYAQQRGFVRLPARPGPAVDPITGESLPAAPQRYTSNGLEMDVSYQPATHRVNAYMHGDTQHGKKFIESFYHDFDREFAPRYGGVDPISEIGFAEGSGSSTSEPPRNGGVPGQAAGGHINGMGL